MRVPVLVRPRMLVRLRARVREVPGSVIVMFAALLFGLAGNVAAQSSDHVLIISGLSGEERFVSDWGEWGASISSTAVMRWGINSRNVTWLAEDSTAHALVSGRSTRARIERELQGLAARVDANSRVLIVMFGHGAYQSGESRISLPGPDVTAKEFSAMLDGLGAARVAVVNTTSASGGFVRDLAAENRIVITATKSGMESNETVFGRHFATALTGDAADTNRDGRLSLLEAFNYASAEVTREYERDGRLMTEHAMLDAIGDGRGVAEVEAAGPHGRAAQAFQFGTAPVLAADASPELRALYSEKSRIEAAVDALRARKDTMPEPEYEAELAKLLLELARNGQAIRRLEGGT